VDSTASSCFPTGEWSGAIGYFKAVSEAFWWVVDGADCVNVQGTVLEISFGGTGGSTQGTRGLLRAARSAFWCGEEGAIVVSGTDDEILGLLRRDRRLR